MPASAALDAIFQRYGWDYWQYKATPEPLMEELMVAISAEGLAHKIEERRNSGRTGGDAAVPTPGNLANAARSAGLPMPPAPGQVVDDPLFTPDVPSESAQFTGWSPDSGPQPDD